ncbi:zinc-binding dehydrogenase [Streptomyces sp. CA-253872]|uniref:zinc-binding dehydrogenase n=1 Tax=Streptomyces sp. CA-253872 TaxID=3240067 RepID=UPI003D9186B2
MLAVRMHRFGPPDVLVPEEVPDPVPGPGEVVVDVRAAGVHLIDTRLRSGVRGPMPALPALPTVPGREVAGIVSGRGDGTNPALYGARVAAHLGGAPGGYAARALVPAAALLPVPDELDLGAAVALVGTGRTALGILNFAPLSPADTVLIPAAAGGLGILLTQYASGAGATVVGLAGGPAKTRLVRENGAAHALDYTRPDWPARVREALGAERPVTVVVDGVGGEVAREAYGLLADGGRYLVHGWSSRGAEATGPGFVPEDEELKARSQSYERTVGPAMAAREGGPDPLGALQRRAFAEAAAGRLRPVVHRFPLREAAAAHRALEERGTVGKVVLEP